MATIKIKGISTKVLGALTNLLTKHHKVRIDIFKPRFSSTSEVRVEGIDAEEFISDLATFCSEVGIETEIRR